MALYSLIHRYQHFIGMCCILLQGRKTEQAGSYEMLIPMYQTKLYGIQEEWIYYWNG